MVTRGIDLNKVAQSWEGTAHGFGEITPSSISIIFHDTQRHSLIVNYCFDFGFLCTQSLSRGIYQYHLKRGIDTDKFLINSYEFNS